MTNTGRTHFKRGMMPWNKGKKISEDIRLKLSLNHSGTGMLGKHHSEETKKKLSLKNKNYKHTVEAKNKISLSRKVLLKTTNLRERISNSMKGIKAPNWKGGISPKYKIIRGSIEFRLWREAVFERDNYTCKKCKKRGIKLHPHHIQNFAQYPELRFAIDNGITLCEECHWKFHKIYKKFNNTVVQLTEFMNL